MSDRFTRVLLVVLVALIGLYVAEPIVDRLLFTSGEPRVITPRGELAPAEQTTVTLFQTVAPSVVQVVAGSRSGQGGTGTGFIWDKAGHIVTNNHVVQGANRISVRMASGDVYRAELVGRAPNYDLAVLRIAAGSRLPPPIALGDSDASRSANGPLPSAIPSASTRPSPPGSSALSIAACRPPKAASLPTSFRPMRR